MDFFESFASTTNSNLLPHFLYFGRDVFSYYLIGQDDENRSWLLLTAFDYCWVKETHYLLHACEAISLVFSFVIHYWFVAMIYLKCHC